MADFEDLDEPQLAAAQALVSDAGCDADRARVLVSAVEEVARAEALNTVAGTATVSGSVVDTRIARLHALIEALGVDHPLPNAYEVSAVFRVTTSQAKSLLKTYEVRHSSDVRVRMESLVKAAEPEEVKVNKVRCWRFEFEDPAVLDYAVERLRRRGLTRGIVRDTAKLEVTVERDQTDRHGKTADQILAFETD